MSVGIKQFWTSLVESKLLDESACEFLESKFESENTSDDDVHVQTLANWLCQQKAISPFQADILLSNQASRLRVGNYIISSPAVHHSNVSICAGHHILTKHPVRLIFAIGNDSDALSFWQQMRQSANKRIAQNSPWLIRIFESVAIPEYRFVASEIPEGKSIADLIPVKSRLPAEKAMPIVYQAANGIQSLHEIDLAAGTNLEKRVFLTKSGKVSIDPSICSDGTLYDDIKNLGILWFRLSTGRNPQADLSTGKIPNEEFIKLKKYHLGNESIRLLQSLMFVNATKRPSLDTLLKHLDELGGSKSVTPPKISSTESAYLQWLTSTPVIDTGSSTNHLHPSSSELPQSDVDSIGTDLAPSPVHMKDADSEVERNSKSMLVPILGSTIALGVILAIVVFATLNIPQGTVATRVTEPINIDPDSVIPDTPIRTISESEFVSQRLVTDDRTTLWETPTTGPNIDFEHVPYAPKIAFSIRPAALLASEQGDRTLRSLGPVLNSEFERLEQNLGFELGKIDHLLITFHANDQFEYVPFYVVKLTEAKSREGLLATWNNPESRLYQETEYLAQPGGNCFYIIESKDSTHSTRFLFSNQALIEESLSIGGINSLGGAMQKLALDSDNDRHITFMFLRTGLFNEEGQKLMGPSLAWLNRKISVAINKFVRAVAISIHLDEGTYLEIDFDHTVDLKAAELKTQIRDELNNMANDIQTYSKQLSSNSFWDNARQRAGAMARDFVTNLRIGTENRQVICNGWYHPAATHNWFTMTELLLTFGQSQFGTDLQTQVAKVPQTLEQLLATPRDLAVSTSPDLVILINNLQQEIIDDYGGFPFEFEIRLMGSDLSKQGITQNQRPSDFDLKQTPLGDILTEIMVRANPDKNISGPDDPNCKMVWVVADDPDQPGRKIIMITTRVAATEKSYELPPAFIPK